MALAAEQVVAAVAARLAALAVTGARIFDAPPLDESDLPCWELAAEAEPIDVVEMGGMGEHTLTLRLSGYARQVSGVRATLNNVLAAGALPLIFADPVPYGLELQGMNRRLHTVGEAACGAVDILLRATYYTRPAAPETIL